MKVALAYLHPGYVEASFHLCLTRLIRFHDSGASPVEVAVHMPTESGSGAVAAARNEVVKAFLATDCDALFWLDADMGFEPDALHRLARHLDPQERPIVGGLCFAQSALDNTQGPLGEVRHVIVPTVMQWTQFGVTPELDYQRDTLVRCAATGSACILIHRSVFEKIRDSGKFDDAATWYFRMVAEGVEWGEDITFCMRAAALDIPTHVDTSVKTSHKKTRYLTEELYEEERLFRRLIAAAQAEREVISLLVPTRGRPEQVREMWETAKSTADHPELLELVLRLDDDDKQRPKIPDAKTIIGPRALMSSLWNECFEKASGNILMHCADDIRFRTQGWDTQVRSAFTQFPDRIAFVHGDDGFQHERIGTHGFLHRRWVDTVGYFVPPKFSSDFNDTWLTEVADMIDRRVYLPDLLTEHLHPLAGKGDWDATHEERRARHEADDPASIYAATAHERAADAEKLRKVMQP